MPPDSLVAVPTPMTSALPAATIGTAVAAMPKAPAAHPEHAVASALTIAMDAILRAMKLLTLSLFHFSLVHGLRAITIEEVN